MHTRYFSALATITSVARPFSRNENEHVRLNTCLLLFPPQMFVTRPSSQRYAELPSLRYGPTTAQSQMLGSGPLRVCARPPTTLRVTKRFSSHELQPSLSAPGLAPADLTGRRSCELLKEQAPPIVRRVRFAELPPKFHSFGE